MVFFSVKDFKTLNFWELRACFIKQCQKGLKHRLVWWTSILKKSVFQFIRSKFSWLHVKTNYNLFKWSKTRLKVSKVKNHPVQNLQKVQFDFNPKVWLLFWSLKAFCIHFFITIQIHESSTRTNTQRIFLQF